MRGRTRGHRTDQTFTHHEENEEKQQVYSRLSDRFRINAVLNPLRNSGCGGRYPQAGK